MGLQKKAGRYVLFQRVFLVKNPFEFGKSSFFGLPGIEEKLYAGPPEKIAIIEDMIKRITQFDSE